MSRRFRWRRGAGEGNYDSAAEDHVDTVIREARPISVIVWAARAAPSCAAKTLTASGWRKTGPTHSTQVRLIANLTRDYLVWPSGGLVLFVTTLRP